MAAAALGSLLPESGWVEQWNSAIRFLMGPRLCPRDSNVGSGPRRESSSIRDPDLGPDFCIDQEKEMSRLGCVSVAAGVTLNLRCHSYNFQFFLQM
jgi:hypothetical protein